LGRLLPAGARELMRAAHARRLRLERAERELDLDALETMRETAHRHCGLPWRRDVDAAMQRACARVGHPDLDGRRCLRCGGWARAD
jgi:hypothetical protein